MKRWYFPFEEVKIRTVYINENETSHFRPVRDSMRIYSLIIKFLVTGMFVKFLGSSVISFVLDYGLNVVLQLFLRAVSPEVIATNVSRHAILTLSPISALSLPMKLPKIAIEPIPRLRVKNA